MKILVINAGSSSLKYQLIETVNDEVLAKGVAEKIGGSDATFSHFSGDSQKIENQILPNHAEALTQVFDALKDSGFDLKEISAVGHRVVHGGDIYKAPTLIDKTVLAGIESLTALAPLHNLANLSGIKAAQSLLPGIPQVAVFDTAFHSTIPPAAYTYAISHAVAEKYGVRRYGFHGTSHQYVMRKTAEFLNQSIDLKTTFWNIPVLPYSSQSIGVIKKQMKFNSTTMQEVEAICDRIVIISKGQIVADDKAASLQKENDHQTVYVEFDKQVSKAQLTKIPAVRKVQSVQNGWLLETVEEVDLRKEVAQFAQKENWLVLTLKIEQKTLEEVFKELTK
jgi:hypothetical protein